MASIETYIKYYSDFSFKEVPFNDVDNVIFCEISYMNWVGIVDSSNRKVNLLDAISLMVKREKEIEKPKFMNSIISHLEMLENSKRYKNVTLNRYSLIIDKDTQFGAICINFMPGTVYVAYEGTDASMVGWKEDFEMSYMYPVRAQELAGKYINDNITFQDKVVYVGGHSKGGNLAMAAAMKARSGIKNKIKVVYNNDGPGFRKNEFNSQEYKEMRKKLKTVFPHDSVFGRMMNITDDYIVIKSSEKNVMQHDLTTWQCFGPFLEIDESGLSKFSDSVDTRIMKVFNDYTDEEKKDLVAVFFSILEKMNIKNTLDFKRLDINKVSIAINELKTVDNKTKKLYADVFKDFIIPSGRMTKEK